MQRLGLALGSPPEPFLLTVSHTERTHPNHDPALFHGPYRLNAHRGLPFRPFLAKIGLYCYPIISEALCFLGRCFSLHFGNISLASRTAVGLIKPNSRKLNRWHSRSSSRCRNSRPINGQTDIQIPSLSNFVATNTLPLRSSSPGNVTMIVNCGNVKGGDGGCPSSPGSAWFESRLASVRLAGCKTSPWDRLNAPASSVAISSPGSPQRHRLKL